MEHLLREVQLVEYHYRGVERDTDEQQRKQKKIGGMPIEEVGLFLGSIKSSTDTMIAPDLTEWAAKQVERDASIAKQSRKAREERVLARK